MILVDNKYVEDIIEYYSNYSVSLVLDTYFKNGWVLESITTQAIEVKVARRFDLFGGTIDREYLIIVSKTQ